MPESSPRKRKAVDDAQVPLEGADDATLPEAAPATATSKPGSPSKGAILRDSLKHHYPVGQFYCRPCAMLKPLSAFNPHSRSSSVKYKCAECEDKFWDKKRNVMKVSTLFTAFPALFDSFLFLDSIAQFLLAPHDPRPLIHL
jgi:hypothetical protein